MHSTDPDLFFDLETLKIQSTQNKLGYFLYDPEMKTVLDYFNATMGFIPASTCKILSAVFALKVLGSAYRFRTTLGFTGTIKDSVLEGDLYLKGTGDPSLSMNHLLNFANKLASQGIRDIRGKFYFDESDFIPAHSIQEPREPWASYNSGISALSLDFNQARLKWTSGLQGKETYYFIPDSLAYQASRLKKDLPLETNIIFRQQGQDNLWLLSRSEPAEGEKKLPIKQPGEYTAKVFQKICRLYGIRLADPSSRKMPENILLFHTQESNTLVHLVETMLEHSNNFMAEQIQLAASRKLLNKPLDIEGSASVMEAWFRQQIPSVNWETIHLRNGSGLSALNRITPEQMGRVLEFADSQEYSCRCFQSLLPVSGWKGSLAQRLTEPEVALQIWAKPGMMNYAYAYSGYLLSSKGKRLIYSIFVNNFHRRASIDAVSDPLPDEVTIHAEHWTKGAVAFIEGIQRKWISLM